MLINPSMSTAAQPQNDSDGYYSFFTLPSADCMFQLEVLAELMPDNTERSTQAKAVWVPDDKV